MRSRGFTLIEILVVVALLAVLVSLAVPFYAKYEQNVKHSEAPINIRAIATSLEAFRLMNNSNTYLTIEQYPGALAALPINWSIYSTSDEGEVIPEGFESIGFRPEGLTYFAYATSGAEEGCYQITATADVDKDATTYVVQGNGCVSTGFTGLTFTGTD